MTAAVPPKRPIEKLVQRSVGLKPSTWTLLEKYAALKGYSKVSEYLRVLVEAALTDEAEGLEEPDVGGEG